VTLIALDDGSTLSGLQRIVENDAQADVEGDVPGETNNPEEGEA
jgi:DNA gyrase subunit A